MFRLQQKQNIWPMQFFFNALKQKPWFINTSRGAVADTHAIIMALDSGMIRGAAIDVIENEKITSWNMEETRLYQNLMNRKNVLLTPHIAGYSHEAFFKMANIIVEKLSAHHLL